MTRPLFSDADRADVFRGIGHPLRRRVLAMLRSGERSVGELQAELKVPTPALSQHLTVLRETGLVTQRADGHRRLYRLKPNCLRAIRQWLRQFSSSNS